MMNGAVGRQTFAGPRTRNPSSSRATSASTLQQRRTATTRANGRGRASVAAIAGSAGSASSDVPRQLARRHRRRAGGAGRRARRRITASTSCRTVKIVARASGGTRVPARCSSSSAARRAPSNRGRGRARGWRRAARRRARAARAMTAAPRVRAASASPRAHPSSADGRAPLGASRRVLAQPALESRAAASCPSSCAAAARARCRSSGCACARAAAPTGPRSRTAAVPTFTMPLRAQHLFVGHDHRVQPLGRRLARPAEAEHAQFLDERRLAGSAPRFPRDRGSCRS